MSELFFRVVFSVFAVPVTIFIVLTGGFIYRIFVAILLIGGGIEFYLITKEKGTPVILPALLLGILLFCLRGITGLDIDMPEAAKCDFLIIHKIFFPVVFVILFIIIIIEVFRADPAHAIERAGGTLLAIFYIGFLGSYLIIIPSRTAVINIPDLNTIYAQVTGSGLVMLLFAVWASDTLAFFLGKYFGKRLLWPKLSPKKTVVGLMGSIIGGIFGMLVGRTLFEPDFPSIKASVIMGIVIGIIAQLGDLFESLIKRSCGVKDSSNVFPGHGGILDRIDALLFCAPVYYYMLLVFKF